ncbi:hypothetical protein GCM10009548_66020 [Streptomyces malaysiensis subsp. malaysiensis]|uniref:Uncharacterized protein n=1 Tax=Streptomyces malaysiensis TaxID=92644 RepID=A0ABX6WGJ9_STRMQ|nr:MULTISPECIES: hypothetical protein [Streptomyces]QPI60557.1 hypothetical protein I1A49_41625 [Streptomyces solisilvae]UHH22274.1 hypothetical protein LUV23_41780 [Streptomyces sp. HNM0561]
MNTTTGTFALATTVEERLGDPYDPTNPNGFQAILAAREAGRPPAGEPFRALGVGGAEVGHVDPESLMHALRAGYRRSPTLARSRGGAQRGSGAVTVGATAVGTLDSGLRMTLRHLRARRLYGAAAIDIPQLRAVLAGAYADLLLCDTLTTLAVRGTDAFPARPDAHDSVVRVLVPRVLQGAMDRLSMALGSRFYIRESEHAAFHLLLNEMQRALFAAEGRPDGQPNPADRPGRPPGPAGHAAPLSGMTGADLTTAPAVTALCDPELLAAAPGRALLTRVRRTPQSSGPALERLATELDHRYDTGRSFGLAERPLPDRP